MQASLKVIRFHGLTALAHACAFLEEVVFMYRKTQAGEKVWLFAHHFELGVGCVRHEVRPKELNARTN